ncbi:hypothetical protein ACQJBY_053680 [Aegilops geniculata]
MHDLLHELAVKVSSSECLSICSSNVKYIQSPPSVRHLSIIIDDRHVNDRLAFEDFKRDLSSLGEKLKVENLKTLMLFGEYQGCFAKGFGALFAEAKSLRVILLSGAYYRYIVEDVLHNLPRLVHLRYLRITPSARLNSNISRLYHLRVIDVDKNSVHLDFPRDMSNLINVRHFLVRDRDLQYRTRTFDVGKLELLQDLRSFIMVKKENIGFEFRQIGRLAEFGESLRIHGIENVERQEEANEAKLMHKINLQKLMLQWGIDRHNKDPAQEDHVLENLKPHSSLLDLHIGGHGGATCPSWLGENLSVKILESLCLVDVAWSNFPPIGELWFVNELGEEHLSGIPSQSFQNLKKLKLVKIPRLRKWVGNSTCHLFSQLEVLIVKVCAELLELPFPGCKSKQEAHMTWFPRLRKLEIEDCPKLLILPPVPWTRDPCSATIARAGSCFEELSYYSEKSRSTLSVKGKEGGLSDSKFWNVLALRNLTDLEELEMSKCPPLPLDHLQMLTCLKILKIYRSDIFLPLSDVMYQLPIDTLHIWRCGATGKELTQLLSHFPNLSKLSISYCEKITRVRVVEQQERTIIASSSDNKAEQAQIEQQQQQQTIEEEEIAIAVGEGLLLLPPQLQELKIGNCPELTLLSSSLNDGGQGGGWLQGLRSLCSFWVDGCPKFLSSYSSSLFPCFLFPVSLEILHLEGVLGMETLQPLINLTSLTELIISGCGDLRGEGIWPLLAHGRLTELHLRYAPKFFATSEPPRTHDKELLSHSCKLEVLHTDDPTGFLAAPVCSLLSSLTCLHFYGNHEEEVERFTNEQEDALQHLTSLRDLSFNHLCGLQCLPAELHRLSSLETLWIDDIPAFKSLPKDGLPSSLEHLEIWWCPALKSLPKDGLPSSLKHLEIHRCSAFESLPKDSLPNSLENLEIWDYPALTSLPKDGLPSSLKHLEIHHCSAFESLPKDSLPNSLENLEIWDCPALTSLPKDGLPSSLRKLTVRSGNSKELMRQCRKLEGTIPIIDD